jgi:hypothetical protein
MGTATSIRLTKPRISAMIVEGTITVVSIVLAVWLLFWFIHRLAEKNPVEAFSVRVDGVTSEDLPFQAADVRLFSDQVRDAASESELIERVRESIKRTGTVVLYLSAPVLATGSTAKAGQGPWIKTLVELLGTARADVVLALDLSQIDTDREIGQGIYGNAPYSDLLEAFEGLKPSRRIFILTSAAPAQKSWSSDGLGHSVFAYYLRKGLSGGDRPADAKGVAMVTVQELHAYVLRHVREWVRKNRHGAVQTPMLLTKLPDPKGSPTLTFRALPRMPESSSPPTEPAPGASQVAVGDAPAKTEAQGKTEAAAPQKASEPAPPDPMKALMGELIAEWKQYDTLKARKPYRYFPGTWRSYQAALLRAERRVRVAGSNEEPDQLARARDGLDKVKEAVLDLNTKWEARRKEEDNFFFRSVVGESSGGGKRYLDQTLTYLTGRGSDDPELMPPPPAPPEPPADPAKAAGQPQTPPPAPKDVPPPGLLKKTTPDAYLELQLPAWACCFITEFHRRDYFNKDRVRGQVLRDIVRARADAERALELDRRGLPWIEPIVQRGDEIRRKIQDELLSGNREDRAQNDWNKGIQNVKSLYRRAKRSSEVVQQARETWEEAAADLPFLVEWAVRFESHHLSSTQLSSELIPKEADEALHDFDVLSRRLAAWPDKDQLGVGNEADQWFNDLNAAAERARKSLANLGGRFQEVVDRLEWEDRDWTALDTALRTPMVPWEKREKLLEKLRTIDERAIELRPDSTTNPAGQADEAPDPGFWVRAAGLAQLDLTLSRIAREPGQTDQDGSGFPDLKTAWSLARTWTGGLADANDSRPKFPSFTAAVRKGDPDLKELDPAAPAELPEKLDKAMAVLADRDRYARLLNAWRLRRATVSKADEAADRYRQLGQYATLDFHFRRLVLDYAEASTLRELAGEARRMANLVPFQPGSQLGKIASSPLEVHVRPEGKLDLKNLTGELYVALQTPSEGDGSIPQGQAFVGVDVPNGLKVDEWDLNAVIPGKLVDVGKRDSLASANGEERYRFLQGDFDAKTPFPVRAVAFYRGRVDDDSVATVNVVPAPPTDRVTVRIGQDPSRWARKYPEADLTQTVDQFKSHQHQGYMHLGQSLDYLLTFENQLPLDLDVHCKIELMDSAEQQPARALITLNDEDWHFEPKGRPKATRTFDGLVSLRADNPDQTKKLKVTLTAANKTAGADGLKPMIQKEPFEVTFSQVGITRYMNIVETIDPMCTEKHRLAAPCYVVTYKRRDDDPFTEPISNNEWNCKIEEKPSNSPGGGWNLPGSALQFHYFDNNTKAHYQWIGRIEGEDVEGADFKGGWPRKKEAPK